MKTTVLVLPLLLGAAGAAGAVDDAAVRRCRALPDTAGRLACYDAMPVADGPPAAAPPAPEARFGMPARVSQADAEPAGIRTRVAGHFDGWKPGMRIALANGQVWRVVDDYDAYLPDVQDPPVLITRGPLGAYFFQVVGNNNSARVVRIK